MSDSMSDMIREFDRLTSPTEVTDQEPDWRYEMILHLTAEWVTESRVAVLNMLQALRSDYVRRSGGIGAGPDEVILGGERAPAAKKNHHAYEGGWSAHCLEMWLLWRQLFEGQYRETEDLNNGRVWIGILLHDLHKINRTFRLTSEDPWEVEYADDLPSNELLSWGQKTLFTAQFYGVRLDVLQYNALLGSEGGYSRLHPPGSSVLSKILYLLDEMSGNVLDRKRQGMPISGHKGRPMADWRD